MERVVCENASASREIKIVHHHSWLKGTIVYIVCYTETLTLIKLSTELE